MRMPRRRRLEGKTDYKSRLALLKSEKPRVIVRKTNRYIIAQIALSEIAQDKIIAGVNSKELLNKGWPKENSGSLKSISAAYLAGFLLGKLALKAGIKEALLDMGMLRNVKGSRIFAVVKGAIDAGMKIPCSEEVMPSEEKINKFKKIIDKLKEK